MPIWAIADLHLSFGVPNKKMDIFGSQWENHAEKIEKAWKETVSPDDLVLIAGDISWAMLEDEVRPDLEWIHRLPGTKVMIKGNHDYWWSSLSKVKKMMPPSCHVIQNNSFLWNGIAIAGTRLWDTPEYSFGSLMENVESPDKKKLTETDRSPDQEKIFARELARLELSLQTIPNKVEKRLVMTHYPPIGLELNDSQVSNLLDKYKINACVFGHLHNVKPKQSLFGIHHGIQYHLVACDFLDFHPFKIFD